MTEKTVPVPVALWQAVRVALGKAVFPATPAADIHDLLAAVKAVTPAEAPAPEAKPAEAPAPVSEGAEP